LASIGLLSAGVAHEINNPLAFVTNNLAVLERDCLGLLELVSEFEAEKEVVAQRIPEIWSRWQAKAEEIDVEYMRAKPARTGAHRIAAAAKRQPLRSDRRQPRNHQG
jgi:C4-dicarboxylate-specific signal transduction histidine kinase